MPTMPAPVIASRHTLGSDVGGGSETGPVETLTTCSPQSQQDLMVLGSHFSAYRLYMRGEHADLIENRPSVRCVGRDQAESHLGVHIDGFVAIVDEREGTPVLAREPCR